MWVFPDHFISIMWNAVTTLGENKVIKHPFSHTSFCETQWCHLVKTRLYKTHSPYFIILASSVKTKEAKVMSFTKYLKINILASEQ